MYGSLKIELFFSENTAVKGRWIIEAARLFRVESTRAAFHALLARLTGRNMRLLDLQQFRSQDTGKNRSFLGTRSVPIDRIRGSENRCLDFDINLRPRGEHNCQRWISVAIARLSGVILPPVELISVGGFYFIRDGHHRVSIARALGELYVDALVLAG